jgi:hypothetical protein
MSSRVRSATPIARRSAGLASLPFAGMTSYSSLRSTGGPLGRTGSATGATGSATTLVALSTSVTSNAICTLSSTVFPEEASRWLADPPIFAPTSSPPAEASTSAVIDPLKAAAWAFARARGPVVDHLDPAVRSGPDPLIASRERDDDPFREPFGREEDEERRE